MAKGMGGGGKGTKKYGRMKIKCQRYRDNKTRFKNKLKRAKQSNGLIEARNYENYFISHGTTKGYKSHKKEN